MTIAIHHAEALAWLRTQPDCSFDAFLSDPPYGLSPDGRARTWDDIDALRTTAKGRKRKGFMGKQWDAGVPGPTFWREVLRVLKPGAPILAFGGTRTYHRLTGALEDAGAEIVDCLSWLYGQGFPKSRDISKDFDDAAGATREVVGPSKRPDGARRNYAAWDPKEGTAAYGDYGTDRSITAPATPDAVRWQGYGTALRPAWEPCVLACKPFDGTIVQNAKRWGVGGLWIDACRLGRATDDASGWSKSGSKASGNVAMSGPNTPRPPKPDDVGRWAPNVLLDEAAAAELDAQSGVLQSHGGGSRHATDVGFTRGARETIALAKGDTGGAARFMYVAKVSRFEREFGCESLPQRTAGEAVGRETGAAGTLHGRAGAGHSSESIRNHHPTLKPIALTEWLATLILPPPRADGSPRRLLIPFAGSGSEAIGADRAGWDEVAAIEREDEYLPALRARIARWSEVPRGMHPDEVRATAERVDPRQATLFDLASGDR